MYTRKTLTPNEFFEQRDIRDFFMRRSFLVGDGGVSCPVLGNEEYRLLKDYIGITDKGRVFYLRAFIDGWKRAKG